MYNMILSILPRHFQYYFTLNLEYFYNLYIRLNRKLITKLKINSLAREEITKQNG